MEKTVAIYTRQSIDKKDSLSIEGQVDLCKKECFEHESVQIYSDKGFSGKNTKRPDFERMINDVKSGKVNKIVVYRLDRFSRSITDFSRIWSQLEEHGVEFVSVNERFDTSTPMGKAMLYIIMVFAQLERETIAERVKDNYYQRSKKGNWPGGPAPFGFKNARFIDNNGRETPTLEQSPEMEIVQRIFAMYSEDDVSLGSVAKILTEEGVQCRKRSFWDNVALSRILHSPLYVQADEEVYLYYSSRGVKLSNSIEEFDKTTSLHIVGKRIASERKYTKLKDHLASLTNFEGVIPSEIWLKCQRKLEQNSQIKNSGKGKYTWLTGLIKCGKCGYALTVKGTKEGKMYLGCSGHQSLHICDVTNFSISIKDIEAAVSNEIEHLMLDSSKQNPEVEEYCIESGDKETLVDIERRIQNLLDAISNASPVTMNYVNKELERLDSEKTKLIDSHEKRPIRDGNYKDINFKALDFDEKKLVISSYLNKILVFDETIELIWRV